MLDYILNEQCIGSSLILMFYFLHPRLQEWIWSESLQPRRLAESGYFWSAIIVDTMRIVLNPIFLMLIMHFIFILLCTTWWQFFKEISLLVFTHPVYWGSSSIIGHRMVLVLSFVLQYFGWFFNTFIILLLSVYKWPGSKKTIPKWKPLDWMKALLDATLPVMRIFFNSPFDGRFGFRDQIVAVILSFNIYYTTKLLVDTGVFSYVRETYLRREREKYVAWVRDQTQQSLSELFEERNTMMLVEQFVGVHCDDADVWEQFHSKHYPLIHNNPHVFGETLREEEQEPMPCCIL